MKAQALVSVAEPDIGPLEIEYVRDAVASGWVSSAGAYVARFEEGFARLCDARHAVAVANGTVALHLALKAAAIGPGDEVIVPSLTFVATAASVVHAGAEPVFVECRDDDWCLDPFAVERAVTTRTKAVIPVHLYGHPARMDEIGRLAEAHGLAVIEDAAEAHGATYRGRPVGGLGRLGCFSFYGNKIMTTGEGGMVVTNDDVLAARLRFLKDHAMDPGRRYWHSDVGYNYRMTNLQAALGCAQLERFRDLQRVRETVLGWYRERLGGRPGLQLNPRQEWACPAPWLACVVIEKGAFERDALMRELRNKGFDSRPFFGLLHEMPPYRRYRYVTGSSGGKCDRRLSYGGLSLPSGHHVTEEDVDSIAGVVRHFAS